MESELELFSVADLRKKRTWCVKKFKQEVKKIERLAGKYGFKSPNGKIYPTRAFTTSSSLGLRFDRGRVDICLENYGRFLFLVRYLDIETLSRLTEGLSQIVKDILQFAKCRSDEVATQTKAIQSTSEKNNQLIESI